MQTDHSILNISQVVGSNSQILLAVPFIVLLVLYLLAVVVSNRKHKKWPVSRTILWVIGVGCALVAVSGPVAQRAHMEFSFHMLGHLLLGMLAPLLMVLAAPVTLTLRTLPVTLARRLSYILKSRIMGMVSDPIVAAILNIGGLWVLYTTSLYEAMHHNILLYLFIHIHVFLAGYLFTISMIYIDPAPHRTGYIYRGIVLILALSGHGILSKYIYAHPPIGIPLEQAQSGGMLMYYGGDMIDLILIVIFCYQWYKAVRPGMKIRKSKDNKNFEEPQPFKG
ncbi:cytochrome c oxidase assembly protein [Rossellomorea sp. SC111]|uniref:cytochrome c oxidase assembly protein n=1 Tax=Rossellomorea sp. SC111 TaxID=2968985 RepID=UPI00215A9A68|nr:cytochrome c oxidase assembly protein [Rossellomorea sp. SC111]MCR8849842.1 cytochrome c oxidase assembly protein [Rossellomorea sp. SC111]